MLEISKILLLPPHIPAEAVKAQEPSEKRQKTKFNSGDKVVATFRSGVTIIGEIVKPVEGSRTLYLVLDTFRGSGWDETLQKYVGVSYKTLDPKTGEVIGGGWGRGQNYGFGDTFKFHINQITLNS